MTAAEARKVTDLQIINNHELQLNEIRRQIERAAKGNDKEKPRYSITYYKRLLPSVEAVLKEEEYGVKVQFNRNEEETIISW